MGQIQNGSQKIWHHTISRSDPTPPSGVMLTVIAQVDPAGIVETAESFMIDAAMEEFNVTMRGINAGRQDIYCNKFENCFIWQKPKMSKSIPNLILSAFDTLTLSSFQVTICTVKLPELQDHSAAKCHKFRRSNYQYQHSKCLHPGHSLHLWGPERRQRRPWVDLLCCLVCLLLPSDIPGGPCTHMTSVLGGVPKKQTNTVKSA